MAEDSGNGLVSLKAKMEDAHGQSDNILARAFNKKIQDELDRAIEAAGEAEEAEVGANDDDDQQDTEQQRDRSLIKRDPM